MSVTGPPLKAKEREADKPVSALPSATPHRRTLRSSLPTADALIDAYQTMSAVIPDSSGSNPPEFAFSPADFERVRQLIYSRAGISLNSGKQALVYGRLSRRLRETGHRCFTDYLKWLEHATGSAAEGEWQAFVNCLTTNLTSFFREEHHFDLLAQALRARSPQPIRIWCNAASTGEEPYSIAMTAAESLPAGASVRILATDIDTRVLAIASQGVYDEDARGLSAERRRRHCLRGKGENTGRMRIKPELAKTVEFKPLNLMEQKWPVGDPFDYVFCRNVMIYFDNATQRRVLSRIHATMKPKAWLFVGHSENFTDARELFQLRGKTVYERV